MCVLDAGLEVMHDPSRQKSGQVIRAVSQKHELWVSDRFTQKVAREGQIGIMAVRMEGVDEWLKDGRIFVWIGSPEFGGRTVNGKSKFILLVNMVQFAQ